MAYWYEKDPQSAPRDTGQPSPPTPSDLPSPATTQLRPSAKRNQRIAAAILSAVSLVVWMSVQRECQREQATKQTQVERADVTTVWIPVSVGNGMRPYEDVEVLGKGNDYIRFRTHDGQVIEQHGMFRMETTKRSEY